MMIQKKSLVFLLLLCFSSFCTAWVVNEGQLIHPLYLGVLGGYGSTTWQGLVPSQENQSPAMTMSVPIKVEEGGGVWGVFIGYELIPNLALEGAYMEYPDATVNFDEFSLFSFEQDGATHFITHTETLNLWAKLMLPIPRTNLLLYSGVGVAGIHRHDVLRREMQWRASPTFILGLNYPITPHWMVELGSNYTTGFGETQLNPTISFFPFLYSGFLRLAYRI